jgi:predicted CxxxxCH...CXXCH cytochrome family protein
MPNILNRTGQRSSWQKTTLVLLLAVTSLLVYGVSGADAALTCSGCHGNPPVDNSVTVRNTPAGAFKGSHTLHSSAPNNYACVQCHIDNGTNTGHSNGLIEMASGGANYSKSASFFISYSANLKPGTCSSSICHGTLSPAWGANTATITCQKCHSDNTATTTFTTTARTTNTPNSLIHVSHISNAHGLRGTGIACTECHTYPATVNQAGHIDTALPAEVPMAGSLATANNHVPVYSNDANRTCNGTYCHETVPPNWNATVLNGTFADCSKCHALPPATSSHNGVTIPTDFSGLSVCASCHKAVQASPSNYSNVFTDIALHIDGKVSVDCLGCHSQQKGSRKAVVGDFASQSHHVQGAELPLSSAHCYKCHWEANSDGTINTTYHTQVTGKSVDLVAWNSTTRPTTATLGSTYIAYTANGKRKEIKKLNTVCLGCHSALNQATTPFGTYRTDNYSPEQFLTGKSSANNTSILSRYSSTRTVAWSMYNYTSTLLKGNSVRYGTNVKNTVAKALSAHGSADKNKMPTWDTTNGEDVGLTADYTYAGNSGKRNVFCYDCHNSHGSDASGITTSYSSATGRYKGGLLKSTIAGQGGYSVTYSPKGRTVTYRYYSTTTKWQATVNPGASLCNDCHNDDTSRVSIAKPWSITGTFSSARAIVGYWSTPYFDNYTVNSTKRTSYKAGSGTINSIKDQRKPMGGHFGSSVSVNNAGVTASSAGHAKDINGLCTPCHDPHGVSSVLGASGTGSAKSGKDYGVPLLKGTWVTTPYREDKAELLVKRGGGSCIQGFATMGAVPGYHIDQNTFLAGAPARYINANGANTATSQGNRRSQRFRSFSLLSSAQTNTGYPNLAPATFAGLCTECHTQTMLTGAASSTTSAPWMSKERIHQSVAGWGSTNGTNTSNKVHAYTCAKCHAPHVSRLPRLLVTNCLDVRHFNRQVSGGSITNGTPSTNTPGNMHNSTVTSARGAGRFPGGGSRYSNTPTTSQNPGGWWFQTNGSDGKGIPATTTPNTASYTLTNNQDPNYGAACHNTTSAGGSNTYNPTIQIWNRKSRW